MSTKKSRDAETTEVQHSERYHKWLWDCAKAQEDYRTGDRSYAIQLLNSFISAVLWRKEIPQPVLEYLATAFNNYLADHSEGDKEAIALRSYLLLSPSRGRKKGTGNPKHQPNVVVARFHLYQKRDGMTAGQAKAKVSKELSISEKQVEADNTDLSFIREYLIQELEDMQHLAAPSVQKK
jgi:hypothetical protein